jgi:hypothetical protein
MEMQYTAAPAGTVDEHPPSSVGPIVVATPGTPATIPGIAPPPPFFQLWIYTITAVSTATDPITQEPLVGAQCQYDTPQDGRGIGVHVAFTGPGVPDPGTPSPGVGLHLDCGTVHHDFTGIHADEFDFAGIPDGVPCTVTGLPYLGATNIEYPPCSGVTLPDTEITNPDYCTTNTVQYSVDDPPSIAVVNVTWFFPAINASPKLTG